MGYNTKRPIRRSVAPDYSRFPEAEERMQCLSTHWFSSGENEILWNASSTEEVSLIQAEYFKSAIIIMPKISSPTIVYLPVALRRETPIQYPCCVGSASK